LARDMSSEVILELVRDQSSAIDRKIAELVDLKTAVDSFAERLSGVITFGEGMYAAVIYEDAFDASPSYYGKLVQFIADEHLEARGDFIHSMLASYVDASGTGKSLHEVSVLVR